MEHFPVVVEFPVRWGEIDALGHVNNTVYFQWFESARIAFFGRTEFPTTLADHVSPILAQTVPIVEDIVDDEMVIHLHASQFKCAQDGGIWRQCEFSQICMRVCECERRMHAAQCLPLHVRWRWVSRHDLLSIQGLCDRDQRVSSWCHMGVDGLVGTESLMQLCLMRQRNAE